MTDIRIVEVHDAATAEDWRRAHNEIIPADPLTPDEVRERMGRHHLEVAYRDTHLVGCTTIRPPNAGTATVIVRVLPAYRRRGIGGLLHERALDRARALGAERIETIAWAGNPAGIRFAEGRGYVEVSRYQPEDEEHPYLTLRLADDAG